MIVRGADLTMTAADAHGAQNPRSGIPVDLHGPSLDALTGTRGGSLFEALSWVFPANTALLGQVELTGVDIHPEGYWHAQATEPRWVRPIRVTLEAKGHTVYFELAPPWLCDERAAAMSADRPEHSVGGHRGLYLGRPLVPRLQLVPRPGLRPAAGARRLSWVLVPDIGPPVTFTGRARTLEARFGTGARVTLDASQLMEVLTADSIDDLKDLGLAEGGMARLRSLGRDGGARSRRFSSATLSAIDDVLGLLDPTWSERIVALANHALANRIPIREQLIEELGEGALQYRPYGDLLRRAIARGALRGYRDYLVVEVSRASQQANSDDIDLALLRKLADRLKSNMSAEIDETIRPGSPGGVVATADDRGTVASLEARRAITRYGPAGERRRGADRLWPRGIHPDRRGELCPLLTPESEDLGLIRSAALDAVPCASGLRAPQDIDGPGDLSVAAGLIPFVNHTDPTRASIAARMLRQAVPIRGAHRPRIETAVANRVANEHGICRATSAGRVVAIGQNWVTIARADGAENTVLGFGPATPSGSTVDGSWTPLIEVGDDVYSGDIVAVARDVVVTNDTAHLAQGRDCLVAYMPWHGWNFEDAIVVSEAIAGEFTSWHYIRLREPVDLVRGELPAFIAAVGSAVEMGSPLVEVTGNGRVRRTIRASADGTVTAIELDGDEVLVELRVDRPLEVGDKLSNRHGAKGVVAAILPEEEMPRLPDERGDGRRVEMILNPLGVIRRLNLSQLLETHVTLRSYLSGSTSTEIVGRRFESLEDLAAGLEELGAPGGRLPLRAADGSPIGSEQGVVVGWQQMLKLDHLASNKVRSRVAGNRSPVSRQPAKGTTWVAGRLVGGAQRLGEMELWALQAFSADSLVRDAHHRSDRGRDSIEAAAAHLRVGGLIVTWDEEGQPSVKLDLDGIGLDVLPLEITQAIEEPRLTTGESNRLRDPLHDHRHGSDEQSARCACGETTTVGAVCATCGTRTRHQPGAERRGFKYRIPLTHPVAHPWAPSDASCELRSIPLLPPGFRPWDENRLDLAYRRLIIENARAARDPDRSVRRLQAAVAELLGAVDAPPSSESVASRLNGKRGLLRRALRGRDTDYAARGVMVPEPTRDPETIGIPQGVAHVLGLDRGSDQVVLVNRQPTLLPTNLVALKAEIVEGSAFRIHPLLCERLAGDFDGDEITVHRPVSAEASGEAWALFRPATSFRHVANERPMFKRDLDVALGLWLLGRAPGGRPSLATRLGLSRDHPILRSSGPLTSRETDELVRTLADQAATGRDVVEAGRELFAAGVEASTGWSFSALELIAVADKVSAARPGADGDLDPQRVVELIESNAPNSALGEALAAGQAGKAKGIVQLLLRRGSLEGFDGQPTPAVEQSFLRGLHDPDYFATAPGGLRALSDKKLVTPLAGGLTKSLIEATYELVVSEENCGSERQGFGAILTCSAVNGVCTRCYRAAGGHNAALGTRVGLLAAFAIGERSTQNAMKAFQGGTTLAVGGNVRRLRALFGDGRIESDGVEPTTLGKILSAPVSSPDSLLALFGALRDSVDDCLDGLVQAHHLEIVWRRLRVVGGSGHARPLSAAQWPGSAFVHATTRGDLSALMQSARSEPLPHQAPSPLRLAVIQGGRT
jgi:hypothetical protein